MKTRFYKTIIVIFLCFVTATPAYSVLQPDRKYFKERKVIDSLIPTENIRNYAGNIALLNSAVNRLIKLGNEYTLTISDAFTLLNVSLIVQHPKGLELGVSRIVLAGSGNPTKVINNAKIFIKEVYKIDLDKAIPPSAPMIRAVGKLRRNGDKLVNAAKQKLDLGAITLIMELYTRDDQVRSIENYVFKDSSGFEFRSPQYPANERYPMGRWIAYEMADSTNFTKLYNYLQTNPFPGESVTGIWSARLWQMMRHCSQLLQCQNKTNLDKYIKQWKYILPIVYRNSLNGEFEAARYAYVHYSLILMSKTNISTTDQTYFMEYAPEEPYQGRR